MSGNQKRVIRRSFGVILLVAAGAVAWIDLYWLGPARKLADSHWLEDHSEHAEWVELQKLLERRSPYIPHEAFLSFGCWGNKANVAWLMVEFRAGRDHDECAEGHLSAALPEITNQGSDFDSAAWLAWWATNQNKSQVEWVQDGFRQQAIILKNSLTPENATDLLKLLGQPSGQTNSITKHRTRPYLRFNAFRWLRDAGFTTSQITTNLSQLEPNERELLTAGLLKYSKYLGVYADNSQKLPISGPTDAAPVHETSRRLWITYLVIAGLTISGIMLWRNHPGIPAASIFSSRITGE